MTPSRDNLWQEDYRNKMAALFRYGKEIIHQGEKKKRQQNKGRTKEKGIKKKQGKERENE